MSRHANAIQRLRPKAIRASGLALLLLASGCKPAVPAPEAAPPRPVQIAGVREGAAEPAVTASGTAASRDEARLSFKVGGVIASIDVREGDRIRRGQRLATIEANEIDAQVAQASAAADKAARDLERGRKLFAQDVVTREQLDDLGTADSVARAQLAAARFNRRYAEILAPDDGRVLSRLAEPRELVAAGTPVLTVGGARGGVVLKVGLADRDALRVSTSDPAEVVFDALPGSRFRATLREVSAAADPRTGTYRAELLLDDGGDAAALARIQSGLIGRARIEPSRADASRSTRVPLAALVEGDQQQARAYVFDAASSTVREVVLKLRFVDGEEAALVEALPPGTQLVTEGAAYLRDGERVRLAGSNTEGQP